MDNKRTPIQLKAGSLNPKSTGSVSKFARPRSNRKQDANSTILLGRNHNVSVIGSARNINQTISNNLDVTISGAFNPRIKSSIGAPANDIDLEYDLAYNEYLQALLKQQIVKKTIDEHEVKLHDQILIQSEHLHKLETTYEDISEKIKNLKLQTEIVEILDMLKNGMDEMEILCEKYNTHNRLQQLNNILIEESNLVSARNIKQINSQEEYDELICTLNNLVVVMQKIQNSGRNFEEVNKLATSIKSFNELQDTVKKTIEKMSELKKKASVTFIKQGSDMFAEQGGYF